MCGFLGEFYFGEQSLTEIRDFQKLLELSKHRGPDNSSIFKQDNFQLGFNRLSILDTSPKGNQPKKSESGRHHLVFNGEIYNYKDLIIKYNLSNLKSTSDTEVIIHLLDKIGIEFAFKILDI